MVSIDWRRDLVDISTRKDFSDFAENRSISGTRGRGLMSYVGKDSEVLRPSPHILPVQTNRFDFLGTVLKSLFTENAS